MVCARTGRQAYVPLRDTDSWPSAGAPRAPRGARAALSAAASRLGYSCPLTRPACREGPSNALPLLTTRAAIASQAPGREQRRSERTQRAIDWGKDWWSHHYSREDFLWATEEEPHCSRRKAILKAHPEVSKLQGPEWRTKYICICMVLGQTWLASWACRLSWAAYCVVAYVIGATLTQAPRAPRPQRAATACAPAPCTRPLPRGMRPSVVASGAPQAHFLAIHEISHNLAFKSPLHNRLLVRPPHPRAPDRHPASPTERPPRR